MKKVIYVFSFLYLFGVDMILAQDFYVKPYCSGSSLSEEHHQKTEEKRKINFLYQEIINQDASFRTQLDRFANLSCEMQSDEYDGTKDQEYNDLKAIIKQTTADFIRNNENQ